MKTKFASQMTRELTKKSPIFLTLAALVLCASPVIALAADCLGGRTYWSVQSGNWFDDTNWSNHVPNSSTGPSINNGGTATIGSTGAESCDLTLGGAATESGSLVVDHGGLSIGFDAAVGGNGTGFLTIENGGTVTAALAGIAKVAGSNGAATVDGTNSQWTLAGELDVGGTSSTTPGTGLLMVTNAGTVTAASVHVYSSGTLTGNATVSTTNGTTVDGTLAPNGGGTTLTFDGGLQLNGGATTQYNVTPQDPSTTSQVSVSAQVSLAGRLSIKMTGDFSSAPTRFTLLYADSVDQNHRTFDSQSITYPTGHCWHPVITYDYTGGHVRVYLDRVYDCN